MAPFEVPLSRGMSALISAADAPIVAGRSWYAKPGGKTFYAASGQGGCMVYMHRLITGVHGQPRGLVVDHLNHNGLDNRRENLKVCTHAENLRNRRDRKRYDGLPGVTPQGNGWVAKIRHQNVEVYLGFYPTEREAGIAYAAAEKVILTAFARA